MTFVPTLRTLRLAAVGLAAAVTAGAALVTAGAALAQTPTPAAPAAPSAATPPALFAVCQACHESTASANASVGPNLWNVGGRKAGSAPGFDYSPAMKGSPIVWSADTLTAFITDPAKAMPGNAMDYPGNDAATAKALADYLMSLKG
jgi:cytochrome c